MKVIIFKADDYMNYEEMQNEINDFIESEVDNIMSTVQTENWANKADKSNTIITITYVPKNKTEEPEEEKKE